MEVTLKNVRKNVMKMTQKDFANLIGFSRQYVSNVESKKRIGSIDFYRRVQEKTNITDAETWLLIK